MILKKVPKRINYVQLETEAIENKEFVLPTDVVSPTDVARLNRELENLDEFFRQSEIRQGGTPQSAPRYSRLLDSVVVANGLNLLQRSDRESLIEKMKHLKEHAPVMHISFSVDPPGPYVQKIVYWLRKNIQGLILVRVGLQPNIGAGCVVRTTNKSFDFSLRRFFTSKRDFFAKKLHAVVSEDPTPISITVKKPVSAPPEETSAPDQQQIDTTQQAENTAQSTPITVRSNTNQEQTA